MGAPSGGTPVLENNEVHDDAGAPSGGTADVAPMRPMNSMSSMKKGTGRPAGD